MRILNKRIIIRRELESWKVIRLRSISLVAKRVKCKGKFLQFGQRVTRFPVRVLQHSRAKARAPTCFRYSKSKISAAERSCCVACPFKVRSGSAWNQRKRRRGEGKRKNQRRGRKSQLSVRRGGVLSRNVAKPCRCADFGILSYLPTLVNLKL